MRDNQTWIQGSVKVELTQLDTELLAELRMLTDTEIGRAQAHLAAGLPMWWGDFNWGESPYPVDGCLVSACMSSAEFHLRERAWDLVTAFDKWATDGYKTGIGGLEGTLSHSQLTALAAILDMEWSRRHPLPAVASLPPAVKEALPVGK